ncbi:MAG: UvrD-helicase domain-containing protein [Flavobacteriaceae bacterium]|nr:UvrD-helicase domain-containing protein [Flavobacteriaceae bacterium]
MRTYLEELNEAQRAPVLHKEGPLMVIAGAGSGKTRVLTYRIAHLMKEGVDPFNILALTFTNKAAREMKKRIAELVGDSEAKNLWMGTFHSIFARLLRYDGDKLGFPKNFTIYDTQDSQRLIASIIKEMSLDKDIYKYKQVHNRISAYKNNLITVKAYFQNPEIMEADAMARRPRTGEIYKAYVDRCFKAGAMDFDDLLLRTNELLNRFPDVLHKYQERFRYILVDEYQDTNHSQYLIVRALADRFQNICVVGDDAQSIYSFRGANISNILNFQRDYDEVALYRLEQNYRSTKTIVNAANTIIAHNKDQIKKEVWTHNDEGNKIILHRSVTDAEEGRYVAGSIFENKMEQQLPNSHFAVLYRTNSQSRSIEDALRKRDIPYRIYGGVSFYQRKEIKDLLSYLRILINPSDEEALKRIINFPARGIGQTTIDRLTVVANETGNSIFQVISALDKIPVNINAGTKRKLGDFVAMIKSFQILNESQDAFVVAAHVAKKAGLLQEFKKDGTPEGIARMENIEELLNGIQDFVEGQKEIADAEGSLTEFLEDVALATDLDQETDDTNRVSLMTIHLAKGLEFPYVYIVGMEEDLFPSAMSMSTRSELEEERRLFYVALTRAEKQAYLTYTLNRYRWGKLIDAEPSRFLEEIDEQFIDNRTPVTNYHFKPFVNTDIFGDIETPTKKKAAGRGGNVKPRNAPKSVVPHNLKPIRKSAGQGAISAGVIDPKLVEGALVNHTRFGRGKVIKIEGQGSDQKAEIQFDKGAVKKLLLRFAKLEVIS